MNTRFEPRRMVFGLICTAALLASAIAALAVNTDTGTIDITNGVNSGSGASWHTHGDLTYIAGTNFMTHVTYYTWVFQDVPNTTHQWFYGYGGYSDAQVYHRRAIIYDPPGTNSTVWESCAENALDHAPLASSGFWYTVYSNPNPGTWNGNSDKNVIYQIQSGGAPNALTAKNFTLSHVANP